MDVASALQRTLFYLHASCLQRTRRNQCQPPVSNPLEIAFQKRSRLHGHSDPAGTASCRYGRPAFLWLLSLHHTGLRAVVQAIGNSRPLMTQSGVAILLIYVNAVKKTPHCCRKSPIRLMAPDAGAVITGAQCTNCATIPAHFQPAGRWVRPRRQLTGRAA